MSFAAQQSCFDINIYIYISILCFLQDMKTVCSPSLFFPSFGTLFLEMNLRTRNTGVVLGGRRMCVGFVHSLGKQLQILIYFSVHKRCQEPEILCLSVLDTVYVAAAHSFLSFLMIRLLCCLWVFFVFFW